MAANEEQPKRPLAEPQRDARLARAIRGVEGAATSPARLELLRSRIALAASAVLESRREREWWEWMARWARAEVALAGAATILAAVIGGATTIGGGEIASDTVIAASTMTRPATGTARVDSVVAHALATGASSEQVMNALVGPASGEWLLSETVAR